MTAGTGLRTAALAVVLLLAGATAVSVVATRDAPEQSPASADEAIVDAPSSPAGRRERRRVDPSARVDSVSTADAAGDAAGAAMSQDDPPGEIDVDAVMEELRRRLDVIEVELQDAVTDATLRASLELDPLRTTDPSRVGAPPEVAFASFLATGVDGLDGAAELVGERRPELEDGDPVALTGRVVDVETGAPIAGASVVVSSTFYVRRHLYDHHLREVARAFTDAAGEFVIPRVDVDPAHFGRGGRLYATVTAGGRTPLLARPLGAVVPGETSRLPDVRLAVAAHTLRGRVVDYWQGAPVVGARVYATGAIDPVVYPKDQRDALFLGAPATVTDDDGRFELTGLGDGVQVVSVHGGDDCIGRETFVVPRDDDATLRTRGIGGRIEGTVVDALGDPIPLVAVQGGGNSTHSFVDGRFVLENFRETELAVVLSHPDFRRVTLRDVPDGATDVLVRLEHLQPRLRLRVRRDADGEPVTSVRVEPQGADGAVVRGTSPTYLDDEGTHLVVVPEGAVTLSIDAEGLAAVSIDVASARDGDSIDVLLTPGE